MMSCFPDLLNLCWWLLNFYVLKPSICPNIFLNLYQLLAGCLTVAQTAQTIMMIAVTAVTEMTAVSAKTAGIVILVILAIFLFPIKTTKTAQ